MRRISTGRSDPLPDQRQETPAFYQPGPSKSRSAGPRQSHPEACRPEDEEEEEQEDEEEDFEDQASMLERFRQLPKYQRYKSLGKLFAMQVWSWPASHWWIGDLSGSDQTDATDREKLENKKMHRFKSFLEFDMDIPEEEWMSPGFKTQVTVPHVILYC